MKLKIQLTMIVLMVLLVTGRFCEADTIGSNLGFENPSSIYINFPSSDNKWWGDVTQSVQSSNGIIPFEGNRMLQFRYAFSDPTATFRSGSNLTQLIDLSSYQALISTGNAVVNMSARFNRVNWDIETDTLFKIQIRAMDGLITDYIDREQLAAAAAELYSDSFSSTWELVETSLILPTNTDYIACHINAVENVYNDITGVEYDGHYADAVSISIVPEPMTLILLGVGTLGLMRRRRKI